MPGEFTFAVVGHNEAARLHYALGQALDAARPGDRVWFVDSASTDSSAARAAALGAEVIEAPLGKGRAIATAIDRCHTAFICFVDGDMESSECNVPATLRDVVAATDADMVIGSFTEPRRRRAVTPNIYVPLAREFFPEALAVDHEVPLSGMRTLRMGLPLGSIPPGYGVEAHLNMQLGWSRRVIADRELGEFYGPIRPNLVAVVTDVAAAILDLAETCGRLAPARRPEWNGWVAAVLDNLVATVREKVESGLITYNA